MVRKLEFEKDPDTRWYAVIPEWDGERYDLEMVMGADTWLELISQGEGRVEILISDEPFDGAQQLVMTQLGRLEGIEMGTGAWYRVETYLGIEYNLEMWLCDVTKFVFGKFPGVIYFR